MKKKRLIIATGNEGKFREIKRILNPLLNKHFALVSLKAFKNPPKVIENGKTYYENALKKARKIGDKFGDITLADDSGLEVDLLKGAPGIISARFAGTASNDKKNTSKLLKLLSGISGKKRKAHFICCALAYFPQTGKAISSTGKVSGFITDRPRGTGGFGYDPVFYYPQFDKTFAQVSAQKKNTVSHRLQAFRKLGCMIIKRCGLD